MPKPPNRFWSRVTKTVFPRLRLQESNPQAYIGKTVLAQKSFDEPFEEVKIKAIVGNRNFQKHFEINGTHLVSMFSFFTQMIDGRLPTPEDEKQFEDATQIKRIEEIPQNGSKEEKRRGFSVIPTPNDGPTTEPVKTE